MTTVYKVLPDGGYTSMPAASEVVVQRLLKQGWSLTPPAIAAHDDLAVVPAMSLEPRAQSQEPEAEPVVAMPKRGRKAKA